MDHRLVREMADPRSNHSTREEYSMRPASITFGFLLLTSLPPCIALAQQHAHRASTPTTSAVPAQRYTTDATLREQMRAIRENVVTLEHRGSGDISKELAAQLADQITGHVNTIIVNCKLPPDADTALHDIIGPLLQNASALKADPGRKDAIARMRAALDQYAHTFDDPAFSRSGN
ncbi:MAG: DnrO protein [Rhodanobacter sp.]